MALEDLSDAEPVSESLQEIRRACGRAVTLTRQLLAFSRKQVLQPQILDLNQIVTGMENMLRRLLREDVQLSVLTAHALGNIYADKGQVEQIVMNLVVNGRDAMPYGGKVVVETSDVELDGAYAGRHHDVIPGPYVMLAITDTGTGMDAATCARAFEPFFTTKEHGQGTGLGLSTVYGIVKQSGGHIAVRSEVGKGTRLQIYFPRTDGTASTGSDAPRTASVSGNETVLIVEDEDQVRVVMRTILRRHGYNVLEAQNGGEAFLVCEGFASRIHLLVTDVIMPRMSGRELAERLKAMRTDLRVLYVSGHLDPSVIPPDTLDAQTAFLPKPISPDTFSRKVREVLDGASVKA